MMRHGFLLLTLCSGLLSAAAQSNVTSGSCSPIVSKNEGTIDIHCEGLDPAVAAQIKTLVVQIASIRKGMATEATQQQLLKLLQAVQSQIAQLQSAQPKRVAFAVEQVPAFVSAFNSAFTQFSPSQVVVEVSYERRSREAGMTFVNALSSAGFSSNVHSSEHLEVAFADADFDTSSGLFASYSGNPRIALAFLKATGAGLAKAGVSDTGITVLPSVGSPAPQAFVQIFITAH